MPQPMNHDPEAARLAQLEAAVARARTFIDESRQQLAKARQATPVPTDTAFRVFANLLKTRGIREAMFYLVGLTDYRFIGIFRFQGGKATSAVHIDRENPLDLQAGEVPDTATYCCYVRDGNGAFVTADAMLDPRAEGHPARLAVPSYCGLPIMDPEGGLIGTLCHYDVVPRDPEQLDLPLLLRVASLLAQSGQVPPYPAL